MFFFIFYHIPSVASEPGTTTFCVRFNSPSTMLKSYCFNPLWAMSTTIFSGNIKPVPHFRANNCTTFAKKLIPGRSLRSSLTDPFRFAKKRCNISQGFGVLNSCVDWSEGFPNMVLRSIERELHVSTPYKFLLTFNVFLLPKKCSSHNLNRELAFLF